MACFTKRADRRVEGGADRLALQLCKKLGTNPSKDALSTTHPRTLSNLTTCIESRCAAQLSS